MAMVIPSGSFAQDSAPNTEAELAPPAFITNCQACHLLDQALVGPSLVEIAELYPSANRADFVKWCIEPGRKRDQMPVMPSMVHVPEAELIEISDYIRTITVGVKKVKRPQHDPFALAPSKTRRPRVERTFLPETGPASLAVALPTARKLNVIWDTDQCRLRYISEGEPDSWLYWRSNGNSLATVGTVSYRETVPLFSSTEVQYLGYRLSDEGLPTFIYQVGETKVTEAISVQGDAVIRTITGTPNLPAYQLLEDSIGALETTAATVGSVLTIIHRPRP